ncbi:unnamed protein product [Leuciscus chuanchicus]
MPICFSEAVRKCSFQTSPPDSEIESEIKVWLRNSRDRTGGRKERYHRLLTMDECRKKWKNLRDAYRRETQQWEQRDTSTKAKQVSQSVLSIQEGPAFSQEGPAFSQEGPAFSQKGPAFSQEGPAFSQEGPAFSQKGPAFSQEGPAFSQEGPAFSPEGPAFSQADQEQAAPAFSQAHVASSQADKIMRQEGERSKKHKGAMTVFEKQLMAALHRAEASSKPQCVPSEDPDELFIRSLLPQIKQLKPGRKERLKFEIHKLVYEAQCSQEEEESGVQLTRP